MGKRKSVQVFEKVDRDFYATPAAAVPALLPFLPAGDLRYIEPCAGDGALVRHLMPFAIECVGAYDIAPRDPMLIQRDAMEDWDDEAIGDADCWITNLPWSVGPLHALILHLSQYMPLWTLLYADWMHTVQAAPLMRTCRAIVSVGRLKFFAGTEHSGYDNAVWMLFDASMDPAGQPVFRERRPARELKLIARQHAAERATARRRPLSSICR